MANDIKQKIVLEGEKEYNRALSDAKRNLKTLRSELKAETAELGANATAQQKNEVRIKSLQKQIKEQEKVVKTYQAALKEVKEKYGDNEEAVAKWEVKLNEARTSLANMRNELEGVGQGFKSIENSASMATVAGKSIADSFGKLSDIGGTISAGIETAFTAMMNNVRDVCVEIWEMIAQTAAKADRWGDLAGFYGSTAEEVQEIDRAVSAAGADFEQFIALMNQLQFRNKDKALVEWLGISDVNYEDNVEFTLIALKRMSELKNQIGASKFNDQLGEVFSGKSAGFLELIDKYSTIMEKRQQLKEYGYLLDSNELDVMSEVNNTLASIEDKWDALKGKFASGFGTVTLDIITNAEGTLDALAKYFNADTQAERDEALKEIETNITAMFDAAAKAINDGIETLDKVAEDLKRSENPTAQALGNILSGLVDALKWLTEDNMNNVVRALEVLAGFWLAGKGLEMGTKIAEIAGNITLIKNFKGFSALSAATGLGSPASVLGSAAAGASGLTVSDVTNAVTAGAGKIAAAIANVTMSVGIVTMAVPLLNMLGDLVINKEASKWWKMWNEKPEDYLMGEKTPELSDEMKKTARNTSLQDLLNQNIGSAYDRLPTVDVGNGEIVIHKDRSPNGGNEVTLQDIQRTAAEAYWDAMKTGNFGQDYADSYKELESAYQYNVDALDSLLARMDALYEQMLFENQKPSDLEDLPADWWTNTSSRNGGNSGNQDGLTSADAKNMTDAMAKMPGAVAKGVSGIRVYMDGATVGRLVAPYVSEAIAYSIGG